MLGVVACLASFHGEQEEDTGPVGDNGLSGGSPWTPTVRKITAFWIYLGIRCWAMILHTFGV